MRGRIFCLVIEWFGYQKIRPREENIMKRKVLALACTLALSAGLLAGCGSSTDTAAEAESTVAAVESTEAAEAESTEAESTETAAEVESKDILR